MTAIIQPGCRDCTQPRGLHRIAISVGLGLAEWGRKRAEASAARPTYDEQLQRHERARDALLRSGPSPRS